MMFGTREDFAYFVCDACDTLQIVDVPSPQELRRHYPDDYYAYRSSASPPVFRWLIGQQDRYELGIGRSPIGAAMGKMSSGIRGLFGGPVVRMIGALGVDRHARILDVGCGSGGLLDRLSRVGFDNLWGADPFIDGDGVTPEGVPLLKRDVSEVPGNFDLVMFNHSLEHVPDMIGTLEAATERLSSQGVCLVRLPTTSSDAWQKYGAEWVSCDPPRHIVVPSRKGMAIAAGAAGLRVEKTFDDSSSYQFFASELVRRDVAISEIKGVGDILRHFGWKQIWDWERESERLNQRSRGEQTGFVLGAKAA
jgi:hypothetical protein